MSSTEQKLQKEIDRLTKALGAAQALNAGLERDKDRAWELVQMMLARQPSRTFLLTPREMEDYDPRRWTLSQSRDLINGGLVLQLKDKK